MSKYSKEDLAALAEKLKDLAKGIESMTSAEREEFINQIGGRIVICEDRFLCGIFDFGRGTI